MKLILTLCMVFALNANALSFTERMSAQNKPEVSQQAKSSLTAEDRALSECKENNVKDYSNLVESLLIVIAFMLTVIYLQNKKIQKLIPKEE